MSGKTGKAERLRCTASGAARTGRREAWGYPEQIICPDCGGLAAQWVRGTDLPPRAKIRTHRAPAGVTPGAYEFLPRGFQTWPGAR